MVYCGEDHVAAVREKIRRDDKSFNGEGPTFDQIVVGGVLIIFSFYFGVIIGWILYNAISNFFW